MSMSNEQKARRYALTAAKYTVGTYCRKFVAPKFQRMVRAEAGLYVGPVLAVRDLVLVTVESPHGFCVCVTCSKVLPWCGDQAGGGQLDTGHFLGSRRNSILFDEANVAPQCVRCNRYESGKPEAFALWMSHVRGDAEIDRLRQLKTQVVSFSKPQLIEMRIAFEARLTAAESQL